MKNELFEEKNMKFRNNWHFVWGEWVTQQVLKMQ
jgi:hypothetical protein